jgi:hypothetical protein
MTGGPASRLRLLAGPPAIRAAAWLLFVLAGSSAVTAYVFLPGAPRWPNGEIVMYEQMLSSGTLYDGSSSWGAAVEPALAEWNLYPKNVRFTVVRSATIPVQESDGRNSMFWNNSVFGRSFDDALAVTTRWSQGSTRTEGDVIFNTAYCFNSYRGTTWQNASCRSGWVYDVRRVALHEFGHVLGLGHPDQAGQNVSSIMHSSVSNLESVQPDDVSGVTALYGSRAVRADFDLSTVPDLIWQQDGTNIPALWYMGGADGSTFIRSGTLSGPVPGWRIGGVADLNGDAHPDLIWQQDGTNVPAVWYMGGADGSALLGAKALSGSLPSWRIVSVADLDGDGHPDLVWQQDGTNIPAVWYMGGADGSTLLRSGTLSGPVPGWRIGGVADLNGDGHADLVWQQDGTNIPAVWYMGGADGSSLLSAKALSGPLPSWRIVGVADSDGDGHPDLIWQQDGTNAPALWYMGGVDGSTFVRSKVLSGPAPGWRVAGPK